MTYFGFLLRFIGIPLALLAASAVWDWRRGRRLPASLGHVPSMGVLLAHVTAAVIWTTPWDNYLVATGVWYYDPKLVTGITLGWVPIEEYTFFVVQTLLTGNWLLWLARRLTGDGPQSVSPRRRLPRRNWVAAALAGGIWWIAVVILAVGWRPGTYLGLALGWLIPPIILQLIVGADLLWRRRSLIATALLPAAIYLSAVDSIAISAGIWTIAPGQSTGVLLGGVLPVEEAIFFLLTNMLIVFGMVLMLSFKRLQTKY